MAGGHRVSELRASTESGLPPVPRPNFRRSLITGILALAALIAGINLGGVHREDNYRYLVIGLTAAFVLLGVSAIRSAGRDIVALSQTRVGAPAATILRFIATTAGYLLIVFGLLSLLNVNPASLLVGGALIGAILGLAAQQTLGNYFAGMVLLLARPYVPGRTGHHPQRRYGRRVHWNRGRRRSDVHGALDRRRRGEAAQFRGPRFSDRAAD